jgi:hypothetical protein
MTDTIMTPSHRENVGITLPFPGEDTLCKIDESNTARIYRKNQDRRNC